MNCTPNALIREARCYQCIPPGILWATAIYTLCRWANAGGCDLPAKATNPLPASGNDHVGALGVALGTGPTLSWDAVPGATSYDVSFNGGAAVNQPGTTFTPPTLAYNTLYTWRVDTVNACGTTPGDVWTFTTAVQFEWTPHASPATWIDGGGPHVGTYGPGPGTFLTTADFRTVTDFTCVSDGLTSVIGWQSLPSISKIDVSDNVIVGTLDLRDCIFVNVLTCNLNQLTGLLLDGTVLTALHCENNLLPALDLSSLGAVISDCYVHDNLLSTSGVLDLTGLDGLQYLYCGNQGGAVTVTLPDLSNIFELSLDNLGIGPTINLSTAQATIQLLSLDGNNLTSLDVSSFLALFTLRVSSNGIGFISLKVTNDAGLGNIAAHSNNLAAITDLADVTFLAVLNVSNNPLTSPLDVSFANGMFELYAASCTLTALTISAVSPFWTNLDASNNALPDVPNGVNNALANIDANSESNAGTIDLNLGTNSAPTANAPSGIAAKALLEVPGGWTVNTN